MSRLADEEYLRWSQKRFVEYMPSMKRAVGDPAVVDEFFKRVRPDSLEWNGRRLHLDIYESRPEDPVLIFHGGIGTYVRFYLIFLSLLAEKGFNIIAVDRPGHGFSEGRRGDCTMEDVASFTPLVVEKAAQTFHDRIGMFGSSLGGITTFYLLPDLQGVRSALCHNWLAPGVNPDPGRRVIMALARAAKRVAPRMAVPMGFLLGKRMLQAISESPFMVDYFSRYREDPVYCHALTIRSVVSYFGDYRPRKAYADVRIPALGLIAQRDGMLPVEQSRRWWEEAGIPNGKVHVIPDAQHMLFHDNIPESLPVVAAWFRETLS